MSLPLPVPPLPPPPGLLLVAISQRKISGSLGAGEKRLFCGNKVLKWQWAEHGLLMLTSLESCKREEKFVVPSWLSHASAQNLNPKEAFCSNPGKMGLASTLEVSALSNTIIIKLIINSGCSTLRKKGLSDTDHRCKIFQTVTLTLRFTSDQQEHELWIPFANQVCPRLTACTSAAELKCDSFNIHTFAPAHTSLSAVNAGTEGGSLSLPTRPLATNKKKSNFLQRIEYMLVSQ